MSHKKVAIIGGGLTGLTAAIRAAQNGYQVDLYEASPHLGGRTRSFFHTPTQTWVDNGPHLLIGAYQRTQALLKELDADSSIQWQPSLCLPLWDDERKHFSLRTSSKLPFSLALIQAVVRMPKHGMSALPSLIRLAISMRFKQTGTVHDWMQRQHISPQLQRDMIEVLCLGAMNEPMQDANADSFCLVLRESFAKHQHARLGWFKKPLSQALVQPLANHCQKLGVHLHTSSRITRLQSIASGEFKLYCHQTESIHSHIIIATPPHIRQQLLGMPYSKSTQRICNIHLWFDEEVQLPQPFIGALGTYGQWFFDVQQQHNERNGLSHLCVVISADSSTASKHDKLERVLKELQHITQQPELRPVHHQIISIQDATHLVRDHAQESMPQGIIDACEQPQAGELPATIETAVLRGEEAVKQLLQTD